jgi:hypothetical protein
MSKKPMTDEQRQKARESWKRKLQNETPEHRAIRLEKMRAYHRETYIGRRDKMNSLRKERRDKTGWYEANSEKQRANTRAYYWSHREEVRRRENQRAFEMRLLVLQHYGGKCACCGETEYKFLAMDHINGNGNKHRKEIGSGGKTLYRWLVKNNFPEGFQVLCHNCNVAKGLYGICPHQERKG